MPNIDKDCTKVAEGFKPNKEDKKEEITEKIKEFFKRLGELPTKKVFDTATTEGRNVFYEFIEKEEKELLNSLGDGKNE